MVCSLCFENQWKVSTSFQGFHTLIQLDALISAVTICLLVGDGPKSVYNELDMSTFSKDFRKVLAFIRRFREEISPIKIFGLWWLSFPFTSSSSSSSSDSWVWLDKNNSNHSIIVHPINNRCDSLSWGGRSSFTPLPLPTSLCLLLLLFWWCPVWKSRFIDGIVL